MQTPSRRKAGASLDRALGLQRSRCGKCGSGCVRIREAADRSVDGHQLEAGLLRGGQHPLRPFGFRPERGQPNFAAWALRSQTGGFIKRASGPGIEGQPGEAISFLMPGPFGPLAGSSVCNGSGTIPAQTTMWNESGIQLLLKISCVRNKLTGFARQHAVSFRPNAVLRHRQKIQCCSSCLRAHARAVP